MFSFKSKLGKIKANEWINQITGKINGKGGGKDTSAQATGTNPDSLNECLDLAQKFVELKLNN